MVLTVWNERPVMYDYYVCRLFAGKAAYGQKSGTNGRGGNRDLRSRAVADWLLRIDDSEITLRQLWRGPPQIHKAKLHIYDSDRRPWASITGQRAKSGGPRNFPLRLICLGSGNIIQQFRFLLFTCFVFIKSNNVFFVSCMRVIQLNVGGPKNFSIWGYLKSRLL